MNIISLVRTIWIIAFFVLVCFGLLLKEISPFRRATAWRFFYLFFTILMVFDSAIGNFVVAWMVDFPLSCFYLWLLIEELSRTEMRDVTTEVATQDDRFEEDRDSLVEFYREGL